MKSPIAIKLGAVLAACAGAMLAQADAFGVEEQGATDALEMKQPVQPSVTVTTVSTKVHSEEFTNGQYRAVFTFWVDANVNELNLSCIVSDLWLGNKPGASGVKPIPLKVNNGCLVEASEGRVASGDKSAILSFKSGRLVTEEQVPAHKTKYKTFASNRGGHFKQDVHVLLTWRQDEPLKPVGKYSGVVKLLAEIPNRANPEN